MEADRSPHALAAWALGAGMLALWGLWFAFGHVSVYETSRTARLEVQQLPHHVASLFVGRVAAAALRIGQDVNANDVLVELDAGAERLRLAEEETRLAGLPPRIASMKLELDSLEAAKADDEQAARAAQDAARFRGKEAEAAAKFAKNHEQRMKEQSAAGGVAQVDALRALAEADKLTAVRDAMAADLRRMDIDRQTRAHESQARMENLKRAIVSLEGEMATSRATIARLRAAIEQHIVRSPISGRIGDAVPLYAGAYVTEGQRLVSIVPPGDLAIVADFAPASAMGRVHPGQHATMRLDGFPWAQFGTIDATVTRVASEIRDNLVRVEFLPTGAGVPPGMMQHGLPGSIEVAIETAAPASLVLRAAGLMLSTQSRPGGRIGELSK